MSGWRQQLRVRVRSEPSRDYPPVVCARCSHCYRMAVRHTSNERRHRADIEYGNQLGPKSLLSVAETCTFDHPELTRRRPKTPHIEPSKRNSATNKLATTRIGCPGQLVILLRSSIRAKLMRPDGWIRMSSLNTTRVHFEVRQYDVQSCNRTIRSYNPYNSAIAHSPSLPPLPACEVSMTRVALAIISSEPPSTLSSGSPRWPKVVCLTQSCTAAGCYGAPLVAAASITRSFQFDSRPCSYSTPLA